jgi:hypothetical protein
MAQEVNRQPLTTILGQSMWDFLWIKWHWHRFFPEYFGFPSQFIPPVLHYKEKRKTLIIFIRGLHNKPQGCSTSIVSAAGHLTKKNGALKELKHHETKTKSKRCTFLSKLNI